MRRAIRSTVPIRPRHRLTGASVLTGRRARCAGQLDNDRTSARPPHGTPPAPCLRSGGRRLCSHWRGKMLSPSRCCSRCTADYLVHRARFERVKQCTVTPRNRRKSKHNQSNSSRVTKFTAMTASSSTATKAELSGSASTRRRQQISCCSALEPKSRDHAVICDTGWVPPGARGWGERWTGPQCRI